MIIIPRSMLGLYLNGDELKGGENARSAPFYVGDAQEIGVLLHSWGGLYRVRLEMVLHNVRVYGESPDFRFPIGEEVSNYGIMATEEIYRADASKKTDWIVVRQGNKYGAMAWFTDIPPVAYVRIHLQNMRADSQAIAVRKVVIKRKKGE